MRAFEVMCEGFRYVGNCTDKSTAPHLQDMMDGARQITYRTFVKAVGLEALRSIFGDYSWGHRRGDIRMKNDPYVTYYRSMYDGKQCYYVRHSGIEYIFLDEDDTDSDDAPEIPVSANRWSIMGDGALLQGHVGRSTFYGTKTPTSLDITSTGSPSAKAAAKLATMIKQSKLEMVTFAGDEEPAKETLRWLSQFI